MVAVDDGDGSVMGLAESGGDLWGISQVMGMPSLSPAIGKLTLFALAFSHRPSVSLLFAPVTTFICDIWVIRNKKGKRRG
jgi:hypothetical protein